MPKFDRRLVMAEIKYGYLYIGKLEGSLPRPNHDVKVIDADGETYLSKMHSAQPRIDGRIDLFRKHNARVDQVVAVRIDPIDTSAIYVDFKDKIAAPGPKPVATVHHSVSVVSPANEVEHERAEPDKNRKYLGQFEVTTVYPKAMFKGSRQGVVEAKTVSFVLPVAEANKLAAAILEATRLRASGEETIENIEIKIDRKEEKKRKRSDRYPGTVTWVASPGESEDD